jgi:4-amino-4-deoxy-L-arabinose transferase-like glycosyltransferase
MSTRALRVLSRYLAVERLSIPVASRAVWKNPPVSATLKRVSLGRTLARVVALLSDNAALVALIAASLSVLATGLIALSLGDNLQYEDERDYYTLATNLAEGRGYSMDGVTATAFRPPTYPVLLGVLKVAGLETMGLRLGNALLAGLTVVLVYALGRRIASALAGAIASILMATYPLALYTAAHLYPQALATVLLLGALLLVVILESSTGFRSLALAAGAGLLLGLLTLTVPSFAVMLIVTPLWLAWRVRRQAIVPALALLIVATIPIGVWAGRNHRELGAFVPVATNGGFNLLLGNSPGATPTSGTNVDISEYEAEVVSRQLDEVASDRFYRSQAIEWVYENPFDAATLYLGKLLNSFSVKNELATAGVAPSLFETIVLGSTYLPLLGLAVARVVARRRLPLNTGEGLLIWSFLANLLVIAVFFSRVRFREPLDPLMILIAACLVAQLLERMAEGSAVQAEVELAP